MTTLVTGGNGFVGLALCRALARTCAPVRTALRQPIAALQGVEVTYIDTIDQRTLWADALQGCSTVIHAAARVHVVNDETDNALAAYRSVNTDGTLNLAHQAAAAGVRRFIFVSSIKVNGETTSPGQAFRTRDSPNPQDPYGISKWEAEKGLHAIAQNTGMEVVIIRPPLVYGPGVKANFAALMNAIAKGTPLPLGALNNRRSLVGLDNLVDFIITCLTHTAAANETFLVSDGEDLSTTELARRLGIALNRPARLIPVPVTWLLAGARLLGRRAAAERLCGNLQVDITKARTLLGWAPPISVDEGLRRAAAGMLST